MVEPDEAEARAKRRRWREFVEMRQLMEGTVDDDGQVRRRTTNVEHRGAGLRQVAARLAR